VDDIVSETVALLGELGIDNHTYVIFTSDHGFHLGQFNLGVAKRQIYDTDLRVPLMVRGPGLKKGTTSGALSSHVDLAPTILDMAKLPSVSGMDGVSLLPSFLGNTPKEWRKLVYVEYGGASLGYDYIGTLLLSVSSPYKNARLLPDFLHQSHPNPNPTLTLTAHEP
jgi:N-acetylglucosamine-6-sulfatase